MTQRTAARLAAEVKPRRSMRISVVTGALALAASVPAFAKQDAPACQDLPAAYSAPSVVLTSAALVAAVPGTSPEYCDVRGTINGHIKFAIFLPTAWNERFQMVGNGGKAGSITFNDMRTAVAGGFATSSTDTGHDGSI